MILVLRNAVSIVAGRINDVCVSVEECKGGVRK